MRLKLLCITLLSILAVSSLPAGKQRAPQPLKRWRIAFVRNGDIWTANGDGSAQKRIIGRGTSPAWSPDRKQIAFARGGNVWTARADGTQQRQLTHFSKTPALDIGRFPVEISWKPGGGLITFSRPDLYRISRVAPGSKPCEIEGNSIYDVTVPARGKPQVSVRYDITSNLCDMHFTNQGGPAWSPNGKRLAFVRNCDVWMGQRMEEGDGRPGWDLTRIAAVARYDGADYRADISNMQASHPAWSPDGRYLVYAWVESGHPISELRLLKLEPYKRFAIQLDAVKERKTLLTTLADEEGVAGGWPCFSPDGKLVAYQNPWTDDSAWKPDVWVISVQTGARRKLITNAAQPAW